MARPDETPAVLRLEVFGDMHRVVVHAIGEVDLASSTVLRATLARLAAARRDVVLDLACVTFMDASGVGVILGAYREARGMGVAFVLRGPSRAVTKVLDLTGTLRVVPVEPDGTGAVP
jgi:anti-anti-sigma factor